MADITLSLAGINIKITGMSFPDSKQLRAFKTAESPDFVVDYSLAESESADVDFEQQDTSPESREFLVASQKIVRQLLFYDVLFFHGVVVEIDGEGILFTAPSGTGKSTHAFLWKQVFGDKVTIINGDKPLLKFTKDGILICGSPWQGKENIGCNRIVPLKAICIISRADQNRICPVSFEEVVPTLIKQSLNSSHAAEKVKRLELVSRMDKIKYYSLECNMDPQAAVTAFDGIMKQAI